MGKYGKYHVDYQRAYRAGMTNLVFALEPKQVIASWGWCIKANDVSVYWRCAATSEGARIPLCSQTGAALGLVSPDGPPGRSHLTYLFFNGGQLRDASQESETWTNKKQPMLHPQEGPEWFIQCINIYTHIYTHTYPWLHFNIVVQ